MAFSDSQQETLQLISLICCLFSFCGALLIIFCYLLFPHLRTIAFRLILFVSISDLFYSLSGFIPTDAASGVCYFQAVITQYFSLSAIFWTCVIARTLHLTFLLEKNASMISDNMRWYHGYSWGIPGVLTLIPALTDTYGESGDGWCWLTDTLAGLILRFLTFYVPLWIIVLYVCWVYYRVYQKMKANAQPPPQNQTVAYQNQEPGPEGQQAEEVAVRKGVVRRIKYYPMVLIVCYFWASINRIFTIFVAPVFVLSILHLIGIRIRGFVNSMVYGFNPMVRNAVLNSVNSRCPPLTKCCAMSLFLNVPDTHNQSVSELQSV